jgi:transposase
MKCGPDECPIQAFSDLTPAEQRVERKRTAVKMAEQGFTQEQIAKQLGVGQATIARDLEAFNLSTMDKSKQTKTTTNPKGAGRPKGRKKPRSERQPQAVEREEKAAALKDTGLSTKEIAKELGIGERAAAQALEHVQIKREAEPSIDPGTFSKTVKEKYDSAIRQEKARLAATFYKLVNDEISSKVKEILNDNIFKRHREEQERAERIFNQRNGIMTKEEFNAIRRALHPDSRKSISDRKLGEAFDTFMGLEKLLLAEKDSPTDLAPLPRTMAEWDAMKKKATAERKAKYAARRNAVNAA